MGGTGFWVLTPGSRPSFLVSRFPGFPFRFWFICGFPVSFFPGFVSQFASRPGFTAVLPVSWFLSSKLTKSAVRQFNPLCLTRTQVLNIILTYIYICM